MDPRAFLVSQDPIAVVLFLVHPAALVKWLGHKRRKHRANAKWNAIHGLMRGMVQRLLCHKALRCIR